MERAEIARRLHDAAADLPVAQVLDDLCAAMRDRRAAVLEAPPGAGKTTLVPLALAAEPAIDGRILMLEPRRLAARGAAAHMARLLGEDAPGGTVGFRVRGQSKISATTRIEVVTEGILTRMLQSEPDLPGVGAVVFDEFHERSIHADLGLAMTLDVQSALRPDLAVLVMSATLDGAPVARLLGEAPVIRAKGRSYPVETRHLPRPRPAPRGNRRRVEDEVANLIGQALAEHDGGILAFLPGEREIRACAALVRPGLPGHVDLHELFGAMPLDRQHRALRPSPPGRRKLVLATAIAETSLTIPDIRVVVDGGLARRARFDPASGLTRLVTERVTRAEAEQRRGRAGRVAPGLCLRNWARAEEGALAPFPAPEIESADLAPLALELAIWGTPSGEGLRFLTPPPAPALAEARSLLRDLGALDDNGGVTALGRRIAASPVHPRLGAMLAGGDPLAQVLAALLSDRDPLTGADRPADLALRVEAVRNPARFARQRGLPFDRAAAERIRADARKLGWRPDAAGGPRNVGAEDGNSSPGSRVRGEEAGQAPNIHGRIGRAGQIGRVLALAYPDRIGMRREGRAPRYLLSGGRGAELPAGDALGGERFIVATELDGRGADARIRLAAALDRADLEDLFADRIEIRSRCTWSRRDRRVDSVRERCLGALVLHAEPWRDCPAEDLARALLAGVADLGVGCLNWTAAARRLQARIEWLRGRGADLPDCSDAALQEALEDWLRPAALEVASFDALCSRDLVPLLLARIGWEGQAVLDRLAPAQFTAPTGTRVPIDYASDPPAIAIRLQEMFGLTTHPTAGPERLPLKVTLLSPAQRPLQTTTDLPGFWASSYADVRKDMRGRYPRHPWPEDPASAPPTRRAKPRG